MNLYTQVSICRMPAAFKSSIQELAEQKPFVTGMIMDASRAFLMMTLQEQPTGTRSHMFRHSPCHSALHSKHVLFFAPFSFVSVMVLLLCGPLAGFFRFCQKLV